MTRRSAAELAGTVLFAVFAAFAWILFSQSPVGQAFIAPPPVEPPASVVALVARLKTWPLLAALETVPASCRRSRKGRRSLCRYRSGDKAVAISWHGDTGRPRELWIQRAEARGATPFAWTGLADTLARLCAMNAAQARIIADSLPDRLSRAPWINQGEPAAPEQGMGRRSITLRPETGCVLAFLEARTATGVETRFSARRFRVK